VTGTLLVAMFVIGSFRYQYQGFLSGQVILNLFIDNGYLLVAAVGATFVILTGGIDLSIGSIVGFTTMLTAKLVAQDHCRPPVVIPIALAAGALGGLAMGCVIHYFQIQPFIVTLAGLFLFRGLCLVISKESISINDPLLSRLSLTQVPLPGGTFLSLGAIVALVVLVVAVVRAALHPLWPAGVRDRRQRAVGSADGAAGGPHEDRRVHRQRVLLGTGRGAVHAVHPVRRPVARGRHGTGRDRGGGDRRYVAEPAAQGTCWVPCSACWSSG